MKSIARALVALGFLGGALASEALHLPDAGWMLLVAIFLGFAS